MNRTVDTSARALWAGIFLVIIATLSAAVSNFAPYSLIPGVLGLLIALSGIMAKRQPETKAQASHTALLLAILGVIAGLWSVPEFPKLFSNTSAQPLQALTLLATLVICGGFVLRWWLDRSK